MVNIIERGILPSDREYRAICNYCKTIFEFGAWEARPIFEEDGHDIDISHLGIDCPVCEGKVIVNKDEYK